MDPGPNGKKSGTSLPKEQEDAAEADEEAGEPLDADQSNDPRSTSRSEGGVLETQQGAGIESNLEGDESRNTNISSSNDGVAAAAQQPKYAVAQPVEEDTKQAYEQQRELMRQKSRISSKKCADKKIQAIVDFKARKEQLEAANKQLRKANNVLRDAIKVLTEFMRQQQQRPGMPTVPMLSAAAAGNTLGAPQQRGGQHQPLVSPPQQNLLFPHQIGGAARLPASSTFVQRQQPQQTVAIPPSALQNMQQGTAVAEQVQGGRPIGGSLQTSWPSGQNPQAARTATPEIAPLLNSTNLAHSQSFPPTAAQLTNPLLLQILNQSMSNPQQQQQPPHGSPQYVCLYVPIHPTAQPQQQQQQIPVPSQLVQGTAQTVPAQWLLSAANNDVVGSVGNTPAALPGGLYPQHGQVSNPINSALTHARQEVSRQQQASITSGERMQRSGSFFVAAGPRPVGAGTTTGASSIGGDQQPQQQQQALRIPRLAATGDAGGSGIEQQQQQTSVNLGSNPPVAHSPVLPSEATLSALAPALAVPLATWMLQQQRQTTPAEATVAALSLFTQAVAAAANQPTGAAALNTSLLPTAQNHPQSSHTSGPVRDSPRGAEGVAQERRDESVSGDNPAVTNPPSNPNQGPSPTTGGQSQQGGEQGGTG